MKRLFQWARCRFVGWHTSVPAWRLIYGEKWQPLYWRYGQVCSQCGMFRPGSFRYYHWRPEHGTGAAPLPIQEGGIA